MSSNESRCINVVSYENVNEVDFAKKGTTVIAKNMTLITDTANLENDINVGLIKESVFIGEHTHFSMDKSVISG